MPFWSRRIHRKRTSARRSSPLFGWMQNGEPALEKTMAKATVFYSWQSDLPNKTNRGLIHEALERAAKRLRSDDSLGVEPVIDRDTQGIAGSPDIHAAILNKIQDCDAAVFDVSFVQAGVRRHPNPNVLIELGFALGTIGWERIVLVLNDRHGKIEELPFDIRSKRVLTYSMSVE